MGDGRQSYESGGFQKVAAVHEMLKKLERGAVESTVRGSGRYSRRKFEAVTRLHPFFTAPTGRSSAPDEIRDTASMQDSARSVVLFARHFRGEDLRSRRLLPFLE